MKNQNGFGVVGLLVLLPFLLSVLAAIGAAALAFKADAHLKHECRVSVLGSQREAADALKKLMKLNRRARSLRNQKKQADRALKLARAGAAVPVAGPAALAAAQAWVATVQVLRAELSVEQTDLILRGKRASLFAATRARAAVMSAVATENRGSRLSTRTSSRTGVFNVTASPKGDLTPDYEPAPTFEKDQVVDLDVTVDVASLLPSWLRELLPGRKLTVSSHCQATIAKKENTWVETLNQVR